MKMMTATPRCISDRFSSVPSTASLGSLKHVRAGRSARELETTERLAHKAHSRWDRFKNPGCGLVDNSPEHAAKCEKVLPCCRIKVLPMLPVAQKEASFTQGVESLRIAILGFPGVFQHPARKSRKTSPCAKRVSPKRADGHEQSQ